MPLQSFNPNQPCNSNMSPQNFDYVGQPAETHTMMPYNQAPYVGYPSNIPQPNPGFVPTGTTGIHQNNVHVNVGEKRGSCGCCCCTCSGKVCCITCFILILIPIIIIGIIYYSTYDQHHVDLRFQDPDLGSYRVTL